MPATLHGLKELAARGLRIFHNALWLFLARGNALKKTLFVIEQTFANVARKLWQAELDPRRSVPIDET